MNNGIRYQVFQLEEILEIIDVCLHTPSKYEQLNVSLPPDMLNIDYLQLEALRQKIGEIGESYVYESEKQKLILAGSEYAERVDPTPAKNPKNGYDILSYTENGEPIYIEVKSTIGNLNTPFYITKNEYDTAKRIREQGGIYQIHRVYNIGRKTDVCVYEDENSFNYMDTLYQVFLK